MKKYIQEYKSTRLKCDFCNFTTADTEMSMMQSHELEHKKFKAVKRGSSVTYTAQLGEGYTDKRKGIVIDKHFSSDSNGSLYLVENKDRTRLWVHID